MNHLTEDIVKKKALEYLKAFYRPKHQLHQSKLKEDFETEGGIQVDGILQFKNYEDKEFLATLEASSYDTREEVRYDRLRGLLFWDSLAISLIFTLFFFIGNNYLEILPMELIGVTWTSVLIIGSIIIVGFVYRLLFGRKRRYHFIYAVEQFKQYFADEQWIAFSNDVFLSFEDDYYVELRNQCIHYGFGLLIVYPDRPIRMLFGPTHRDLFDKKRKRLNVFDTSTQPKKRWVGSALGEWREHVRTYRMQWFTSFFSIVLIALIFYKKLDDLPIHYVGNKAFEQVISERGGSPAAEPEKYFIDTMYIRPFELDQAQPEGEQVQPRPQVRNNKEIIITKSGVNAYIYYSCERFYNLNEIKYLVEDQQFYRLADEKERLRNLSALKIPANAILLSCFYKEQNAYSVYLNTVYNSLKEASEATLYYDSLMISFDLEPDLKIKQLVPSEK